MKRWCTPTALLLVLLAAPADAQSFDLSVPVIMRGPEHVGEPPSNVTWSDDGRWIFFRWKPGGTAWHESTSLYRVRAAAGEPERLDDATADSLGVLLANGDVSSDGRSRVVSYQGDLYLIDRRNVAVRRLTDTRTSASSPVFSRDGRTIYYVSSNNVFALSLADGTLRQITDLRSGPAPADPRPATGQRGYLEQQQRDLFEHIRLQIQQREQNRERTRAREERAARQPAYLERSERVASLEVEPAGRYAVVTTASTSESSAQRTSIPSWVTEAGYPEPREYRT
jgi:hypothetical protein